MADVDETNAMASDWNISVLWRIDESAMVGASKSRMLSRGHQLTIAASGVLTS
jgi:hypothetical protein